MAAEQGYGGQGKLKITNATRMKFLSTGGGERSPDTAPRDPEKPACDLAPANESQLERKRRLNRNNERKKRAKRILRIEDMTAKFHSLTTENETLKAEGEDLKQKIASVKKFMDEQRKKPAVQAGGQAQTQGSSAQVTVLGSPQGGRILGQGGTAATKPGMPQTQQQLGAPAFPDLSSVVASLTGPTGSAQGQPNPLSNVDLSVIPREQRIRLLQLEFEKQDRILSQLRVQSGVVAAPQTPAPAVASVQPSQQLIVNGQEQVQALIRQATTQLCGTSPLVAPSPAPLDVDSQALLQQLQDRLSAQTPSSATSSFASGAASEGGSVNSYLMEQQLLLALETIQNQRRGNDGGR